MSAPLPIRFVMVNTSQPGNIGAMARAMKNMCLSELYLVNPRDFPDPTGHARARASGARDVLEQAIVVDSLATALQDCVLVVGASARLRSIPWPVVSPREMGQQIVAEAQSAPVAVVFGNETNGLSNEELEQCNALVHIPANPEYSSLNIAAAGQILAYEIYVASQQDEVLERDVIFDEQAPASTAELNSMYEHFETALTEIGFLDPKAPRQLMRRLRRLFNRARLDLMEVNILRGILSAAQGNKMHKRPDRQSPALPK
ncbi:MAG: RNA methyltransferase [Gammaproteobacteria bacterium]